ncbi:MAG: 50S ribosomal protein L6 [Spirochaetia bacterium]|nr:50S ribosomal protein L6 [Spirochaetia bacterium]MCF7953242.1 50S ribosomal protein L6 [Spirochaetales bacterium]
MSRIGKLPVKLPKGVTVTPEKTKVTVKGPKGELVQDVNPMVAVTVEAEQVIVERKNDSKQARSYHGLYRKLIQNMVTGVSDGFKKTLLINGVGYRAEVKGKSLLLNLGYSNQIEYVINDDITITCDGQNKVIVSGIDRQKVGQASAEIRSLRPPEPYKGKGIKYEDEYVRRKIGKSGIK